MNDQDSNPPTEEGATDPTPKVEDRTGWSQPPAPQSPGPPGAFVDRPAVPPGVPLPPGAGSPLQPGPPMSVNAPINDTTINRYAVVAGVVIVAVILIVLLVILGAVFGRH
jgi:hypothetical protein